jgi:hypothetical protein
VVKKDFDAALGETEVEALEALQVPLQRRATFVTLISWRLRNRNAKWEQLGL